MPVYDVKLIISEYVSFKGIEANSEEEAEQIATERWETLNPHKPVANTVVNEVNNEE